MRVNKRFCERIWTVCSCSANGWLTVGGRDDDQTDRRPEHNTHRNDIPINLCVLLFWPSHRSHRPSLLSPLPACLLVGALAFRSCRRPPAPPLALSVSVFVDPIGRSLVNQLNVCCSDALPSHSTARFIPFVPISFTPFTFSSCVTPSAVFECM